MRFGGTLKVLSALFACLVLQAGAVMPGVLQFSQGNATIVAPLYQVALSSSDTILWAVAPGGLVYQINATTMQYITSTTLSAPSCGAVSYYLATPTCLFTDDTHGRVYACFAPTTGACMNIFILNAATLATVASVGYTPLPTTTAYTLSLTQHYYDSSSRMLASASYSNGGVHLGIQLYNVSSDSLASGASVNGQPLSVNNVGGITYSNAGGIDTLYVFSDYSSASGGAFYNPIYTFASVSAGGTQAPSTTYIQPFFTSSNVPGSGQFVSGPMTATTSYLYAAFDSTVIPSQGSYLLQFTKPLSTSGGSYSPKSAIAFPAQTSLLTVALDETAISATSGVLFVSTSSGQLLKYRYSDPGGSTTISVASPNYNSDTQVSSVNPGFSYQAYSKTTQAIFLSSPASSGGIWRVPFYDCAPATSCSSCTALNDPYCGWCPLSGTCTTNGSCSTGKISPTNRANPLPLPHKPRAGIFERTAYPFFKPSSPQKSTPIVTQSSHNAVQRDLGSASTTARLSRAPHDRRHAWGLAVLPGKLDRANPGVPAGSDLERRDSLGSRPGRHSVPDQRHHDAIY
jgi:hypothetical protein